MHSGSAGDQLSGRVVRQRPEDRALATSERRPGLGCPGYSPRRAPTRVTIL